MKFVTKLALHPDEKEAVFSLRYRVYAEEYEYINPADYRDRKEYDLYDEQAALFLTTHGDEPAATMRIIVKSPAVPEFPTEKFFRRHITPVNEQYFRLLQSLEKEGRVVAEGSRVAIPAAYRKTRAFLSLVQAAFFYCRKKGITDMIGICNCFDNIPQLYAKIGFQPVGKSFYYQSFHAEVQLMHGSMENLTGRRRKMVLPPAAQW
ncbi:MAG: N-acyl amino acid synthase FeeM domain-containing protein [Bacillota bacterium]